MCACNRPVRANPKTHDAGKARHFRRRTRVQAPRRRRRDGGSARIAHEAHRHASPPTRSEFLRSPEKLDRARELPRECRPHQPSPVSVTTVPTQSCVRCYRPPGRFAISSCRYACSDFRCPWCALLDVTVGFPNHPGGTDSGSLIPVFVARPGHPQ